jgi:hypothetical protein
MRAQVENERKLEDLACRVTKMSSGSRGMRSHQIEVLPYELA